MGSGGREAAVPAVGLEFAAQMFHFHPTEDEFPTAVKWAAMMAEGLRRLSFLRGAP
jgi:hypothetical protein